MRLFIPEIGTKLELTKNWSFKLYEEGRNDTLFEALNICILPIKERKRNVSQGTIRSYMYHVFSRSVLNMGRNYRELYLSPKVVEQAIQLYWIESIPEEDDRVANVSLPKWTILTVDRIYIRKWASWYSSISFYAQHVDLGKKRVRFWAKLSDVNTIDCDIIEEQ